MEKASVADYIDGFDHDYFCAICKEVAAREVEVKTKPELKLMIAETASAACIIITSDIL